MILSIMNLIDRFLIDEYWVGHTGAWIIPGTEDLRPYITAKDKRQKWIIGTIGMAALAAILSGVMSLSKSKGLNAARAEKAPAEWLD